MLTLSLRASKVIQKVLQIDHTTLTRLSLSHCGLKDEGFIKIVQNLPINLKELDISENSQFGIK